MEVAAVEGESLRAGIIGGRCGGGGGYQTIKARGEAEALRQAGRYGGAKRKSLCTKRPLLNIWSGWKIGPGMQQQQQPVLTPNSVSVTAGTHYVETVEPPTNEPS